MKPLRPVLDLEAARRLASEAARPKRTTEPRTAAGSEPTPGELRITLSLPVAALSPNSRCHWAKKAAAVKKARASAKTAAWLAMTESNIKTNALWPWKRATIEARFFFPTSRFWDDDNCIGSLKAIRDGLADAGIVENDKYFLSRGVERFKDKARPRLELLIRKVG